MAVNPAGTDYDVYFTDDSLASVDYFPAHPCRVGPGCSGQFPQHLHWRPAQFQGPLLQRFPQRHLHLRFRKHRLRPPRQDNRRCPVTFATASEPFIRSAVAHELFHHVQYNYINFNDWPSWGGWTVDGTARLMEDKITLDNDITPGNTWYVGEVNGYPGQSQPHL